MMMITTIAANENLDQDHPRPRRRPRRRRRHQGHPFVVVVDNESILIHPTIVVTMMTAIMVDILKLVRIIQLVGRCIIPPELIQTTTRRYLPTRNCTILYIDVYHHNLGIRIVVIYLSIHEKEEMAATAIKINKKSCTS